MKIGIDIQSTVGEKTGIGYYTKNLIKRYDSVDGIIFEYYKNATRPALNTLSRMRWESFSLPKCAEKDRIDILHIPGFAGPIAKSRCKRITTVHDLIGMIYPENLAPISRFYWQKWLPACIKKSDFIIADSENTKEDIIKFLKIPENKIKVIYLAAEVRFKPLDKTDYQLAILNNYGISKNYILNVGTIEPRKNVIGLIEAFGQYLKKSKREDLVLVIAGKNEWGYHRCYQKVVESGLNDKVIFCGYVRDEDLPVLYSFADVFVYPSFYEGFGLPVLEAMSCGVPVICSKISSLPEITGEAALFVGPDSIDSIKDAIATVLENKQLRAALSEKSIGQSKRFSWEKTVAETIKTYRDVLS